MDQLNGDLLGDSDSDDQDYVPSGGESDVEKEETNDAEELPEQNESQKRKTDALWADFLSDVDPPSAKKAKSQNEPTTKDNIGGAVASAPETSEGPSKGSEQRGRSVKEMFDDEPGGSSSSKIMVKQVFDFAGEKIEVEKEVDRDSREAKKILAEQEKQKDTDQKVLVRPKVGGGLSTIVGSVLNKKNKMSVLEKSRLDWTGFKQDEGINEELANHNKGKGGYLEKMAFLDRADLRQFENEKAMREKQRSSRGGNM